MTLPPIEWARTAGERKEPLHDHQSVEPGTCVEWGHSRYTVHVTAAMTGGRLGVYESVNAPDSGPPRHVQGDDEIIYVLEGEILVWAEGRTERKRKGDSVFVPAGTEHTFRVVGPEPARFLVMESPGGFEGFFAAVASRGLVILQDMEAIEKIAADFNLRHTGPPLEG